MLFNDCHRPFIHFTHGHKYTPPISGAFCWANCKNFSTLFSYLWLMRVAFIQLRSIFCVLSYGVDYPICMTTSLFHKKVWPYPFREDNFLLDSHKQVKTVMLNLTKFWQHFALLSKYTTWKWWHQFTMIMYAPGEQSNMH